MRKLDERLAALATMSPAELREQWQRVHKSAAPTLGADLLRRGLAYQLQTRSLGGLTPAAERELRALATAPAAVTKEPRPVSWRPGSRFVRDWGGRTWTVEVAEQGYLFEGRRYASLSHIAREITGAHWSGPRFFGLKSSKTKIVGGDAAGAGMRTGIHAQR